MTRDPIKEVEEVAKASEVPSGVMTEDVSENAPLFLSEEEYLVNLKGTVEQTAAFCLIFSAVLRKSFFAFVYAGEVNIISGAHDPGKWYSYGHMPLIKPFYICSASPSDV